MNVFWYELGTLRRSTLIWTLTLSSISILFLSIYPAYATNASLVISIFEGFPIAVREAAGIYLEHFFSVSGYYGFVFTYIALCGAIQAMYLGLAIISKEMRMRTADFLLTKPIKRSAILMSKLSASLISLILTNIVYIIVTVIMANSVAIGDYSLITVILMSLSLFFIQLMFLSLGMFFATFAKKIKSVLPITLSTVFAFYAISMLGSVIGDENIKYFSPFKYFDINYIIENATYENKFFILSCLWIALAIALTFWHYTQKEVRSL